MDHYLRQWLQGEGGPGGNHGGDDPNEGLDGRPPPGGWKNIVPYEDANQAAAVANHGAGSPGYYPPGGDAGAAPTGAMEFNEGARAGNLYMGGFIPLLNYGWANQGNPAASKGAANPYGGYGLGMSRLDTGLATLYGTPDPGGAGRQPVADPAAADPNAGKTIPAGAGGGESRGAPGSPASPVDDKLRRYLYGV